MTIQIPARYNFIETFIIGKVVGNMPPNIAAVKTNLTRLFDAAVTSKMTLIIGTAKNMPISALYKKLVTKQSHAALKTDLIEFWKAEILPDIINELINVKNDTKNRATNVPQLIASLNRSLNPVEILSAYNDFSEVSPDEEEEAEADAQMPSRAGRESRASGRGSLSVRCIARGATMFAAAGAARSNTHLIKGMGMATLAVLGATRGMSKPSRRVMDFSVGSSRSFRSSGMRSLRGSNVLRAPDISRESEIEGGKTESILAKIERNTAMLLRMFSRGGKEGGKKGSIFDMLGGLLSSPMAKILIALSGIAASLVAIKSGIEWFTKNWPDKWKKTKDFAMNAITFGRHGEIEKAKELRSSQGNQDEIVKYLENTEFNGRKLTKNEKAAILSTIHRESNFDPTAEHKDSGAFGIFQWLGDRKKRFFKYAEDNKLDPYDIKTQMDFWQKEASDKNYSKDGYEVSKMNDFLKRENTLEEKNKGMVVDTIYRSTTPGANEIEIEKRLPMAEYFHDNYENLVRRATMPEYNSNTGNESLTPVEQLEKSYLKAVSENNEAKKLAVVTSLKAMTGGKFNPKTHEFEGGWDEEEFLKTRKQRAIDKAIDNSVPSPFLIKNNSSKIDTSPPQIVPKLEGKKREPEIKLPQVKTDKTSDNSGTQNITIGKIDASNGNNMGGGINIINPHNNILAFARAYEILVPNALS